jgi:hypothetical protein
MIEGFATADYFNIRCAKCKRETLNEYLGYDPSMPVIRATCSTCKAWPSPATASQSKMALSRGHANSRSQAFPHARADRARGRE